MINDGIKTEQNTAFEACEANRDSRESVVHVEIERNQRHHMPSKGNQSDLAVVGRMVGVACCVVGWLCEARCGVQSKPASPAALACVEGGGPWMPIVGWRSVHEREAVNRRKLSANRG